MPLTQFIDLYCERMGRGLWGEPANALTNLAYFAGAWAARRQIRSSPAPLPVSVRMLPLSIVLVGMFSLVFHTLATLWAAVADQLFILLFGCLFLYAFLRHAATVPAAPALLAAVAFGVASYFTPGVLPPGWLNRSGAYAPYLIGLIAMAGWLAARGRMAAKGFAVAIGLFCVALVLRTGDQAWCGRFPIGTHFLWHVLTGAVLSLLSIALLRDVLRPR
ncbi:MAG: ceramidase domain-containing protein [Burkholderiales bacterium]|nr:ceramidase domain-containing protein [Burkholderiales bacterium]